MGAHTDRELAALGLLADGLDAPRRRTSGVAPPGQVVERAHRDMLELQSHAREELTSAPTADVPDRIRWTPVLVTGALVLLVIVCVLWLAGGWSG